MLGGMVCAEVNDKSVLSGYAQFARERGVFARPFLNCMYACVPYVISDGELERVLSEMKEWFER